MVWPELPRLGADVEAGEAVGEDRRTGVKAAKHAGAAGGERDGAELEDDGAAELEGVPGGEGGLAVEAGASGESEAGAGEGKVGAGVGKLPGLEVEGGLVEGVGDDDGVAGRGCGGFAEQVEDGGGAVADEELREEGGGFFGTGDGDVVGEFAGGGSFEGGDGEGAVARGKAVLDGTGEAERQGSVERAVGRVGCV